ncbi:hypothetical protein GCM10022225_00660 [Plantactinospora mayteni]|uniref:Uncharacterized protein n=1 Tax=Plantactinospora mayteni TaxID=566021 RepID=A0ABQ4EYG6_9ACTN|nr:hypothetical protein Pma05_62790 [Plantactinospora mayteni]
METIYGLPRGDYDRPSLRRISLASAAPGDPHRVDSAPIAGHPGPLGRRPAQHPAPADDLLAVGTTSLVPLKSDLADRTL